MEGKGDLWRQKLSHRKPNHDFPIQIYTKFCASLSGNFKVKLWPTFRVPRFSRQRRVVFVENASNRNHGLTFVFDFYTHEVYLAPFRRRSLLSHAGRQIVETLHIALRFKKTKNFVQSCKVARWLTPYVSVNEFAGIACQHEFLVYAYRSSVQSDFVVNLCASG